MSLSAYLVCHSAKEAIYLGKRLTDADGTPTGFWRGDDEDVVRRAIELFLARHLLDGVVVLADHEYLALEDAALYWRVEAEYGLPPLLPGVSRVTMYDHEQRAMRLVTLDELRAKGEAAKQESDRKVRR